MSTEILYLLSFLLPLVLIPFVLPAYVLMGHRKRITDNPGVRKLQNQPVAVMGGMPIMLVICITSLVVNIFFDISSLFPVLCVMFMLHIIGMLDDSIGLTWKYKLMLQSLAVVLLFFGSNYGIHFFYGSFGLETLSPWVSFLVTLFCGVFILNAVNFADGIDGLASAIGVMTGLMMGYWHMRHGFEIQTILSLIVAGVMVAFFVFNVFSERYKSYMGDSGSLVLGLFIYIIVSNDSISRLDGSFLADNYIFSFIVATLSYVLFDMIRVVALRLFHHKPPYEGDRTHLHHIYADMGLNHLLSTLVIILTNLLVVCVWGVTAVVGMPFVPQLLATLVAGAVLIWSPYFVLTFFRDRRKQKYEAISTRCKKVSAGVDAFVSLVGGIIDGKSSMNKKNKQKITDKR